MIEDRPEILQLVVFVVEGEEYGIDIKWVREIVERMPTTRVPHAPNWILGVTNLRGQIVPITDFRSLIRGEKVWDNRDTSFRLVICELPTFEVGLSVDEVKEILRIPPEIINPAPETVAGIEDRHVVGVANVEDGRLVTILDIETLLIPEESSL